VGGDIGGKGRDLLCGNDFSEKRRKVPSLLKAIQSSNTGWKAWERLREKFWQEGEGDFSQRVLLRILGLG